MSKSYRMTESLTMKHYILSRMKVLRVIFIIIYPSRITLVSIQGINNHRPLSARHRIVQAITLVTNNHLPPSVNNRMSHHNKENS